MTRPNPHSELIAQLEEERNRSVPPKPYLNGRANRKALAEALGVPDDYERSYDAV